MTSDDRQTILEFLKTNTLATLSTVEAGSGRPQAALVAFAELETLEIVFQTFHDTRKYRNLCKDPAVAFVIGWSLDSYITLQYEGTATPIAQDKAHEYHEAFLRKDSPISAVFLQNPKARFFKVRPIWLRYSDYGCQGSKVIELDFCRLTS